MLESSLFGDRSSDIPEMLQYSQRAVLRRPGGGLSLLLSSALLPVQAQRVLASSFHHCQLSTEDLVSVHTQASIIGLSKWNSHASG